MEINEAYDQKLILKLFNCCTKLRQAYQRDDINAFFLERSISFADYVDEFGIGILLLPNLIDLLEGELSAKLVKNIGRKQLKPKIIDSMSAKSEITCITTGVDDGVSDNNANNAAPSQKSLIINLKVPMYAPENENSEG